MNGSLEIHTLGGLTIECDGQLIVGFASRKVEALLVYLACTGHAHPREVLAELLWEERSQAQSLSNLRVALASLRQQVGPYVTITRQTVAINPGSAYWLDVAELERNLSAAAAPLEQALSLYQGDFLAGFYIRSRGFEDWVLAERERLRFRVMEALEHLVREYIGSGKYAAAITHATQLLRLDTLREETYRQLMLLLARSGQRGAALAQYETCCRMLQEELGIEPAPETLTLYEQIRAGEIAPFEVHAASGLLSHRFRISEQIGQGEAGEVFRGIDLYTQQPVAIKVLRLDILVHHQIGRFKSEVEVLRRLNHPNIVKVLATLEENDQCCMVMDYVGGGSLHDLLQPPIPVGLQIALDLADALAQAHRWNVIHGDLKPANVLLAENGAARLTDFGMAYLIDRTQLPQTIRMVSYLSPEALHHEEVDGRADIWAFGVMLFEMLAGHHPFGENTADAAEMAILTRPIPDLEMLRPDVPIGLIDLIYRMLEKDRHARIPSIRLVGAELEAILQGTGSEIRQAPGGGKSVFAAQFPIRGVPKYHLQAPLTPFVGREVELAGLEKLLSDPQIRLVTIHGPGGVGKTCLALECAAQQFGRFVEGVRFVALMTPNTIDSVVSAIADAFNFTFSPTRDNKQQLLNYLRGMNAQNVLLVLDNFEHGTDSALLITEILSAAPAVKILVTSREKLNLSSEVVFKLGGMKVPKWDTFEEAIQYDAVRLFIQSARRVQPGFELKAEDLAQVLRICRRVLGMPLGIVLAAAWVEMLSLQEIADEIDQNLDFLEADIRDMPERHRSIRAVFESAWDRLSDTERDVFMKLSVFRGGVKRQIAQYVTRASLNTLTALVNKSLLLRDPDSGRYEVHELLRQYAEEKLEEAGLAGTARDIHSHYYLSLLCQRGDDLKGHRQYEAMKEIEADFENVRAAWSWAVQKNGGAIINLSLDSLFLFCSMRGFFEPGAELLRQGQNQFAPKPEEKPQLLWARILVRRELLLDPHHDIRVEIERCLAIARQYGDPAETAFCLTALGYALSSVGDYTGAIPIFEESLSHYRVLNDLFYMGRVLSDIGLFYGVLGQRDRSAECFQQALDLQREIGDEVGATHLVIRNGINTRLGE
jgi:DNA-binding SARP family transcriptional activator/predicted ATPase